MSILLLTQVYIFKISIKLVIFFIPNLAYLGASPGCEPLPPWQEANSWPTGPVQSVYWNEAVGLPQDSPPPQQLDRGFNRSLCCERRRTCKEWNGPGKAWLRPSRNREQRGPIVAADQGSPQGQQCSKTWLTGEPGSIVRVGASLEREPLPPWPLGGKQTVDPLDQWDCALEWSCRASTYYIYLPLIADFGKLKKV